LPRSRQCVDTVQAARHASAADERPQERGQVAFLVSVDKWCLRTCARRPGKPHTRWLSELQCSRQCVDTEQAARHASAADERPQERAQVTFLVSVDRWCLRTCAGQLRRPNTRWLRDLPRSRQCSDTVQAPPNACAAAERPQERAQVTFLVSVDRWCLRTCVGRPGKPYTRWLREVQCSRQGVDTVQAARQTSAETERPQECWQVAFLVSVDRWCLRTCAGRP